MIRKLATLMFALGLTFAMVGCECGGKKCGAGCSKSCCAKKCPDGCTKACCAK
mgnify:CR=1 FL=1